MKKLTFLFALLLFVCQFALAQTGGINFQGLARNASGEVLVNQKITLRFSVILSSETGTTEYLESKEATTNAQGMFSLVIGEGSILTKTGNFSDINWKVSPKFLKVEMDPSAGTNFTVMGTSKLQAVPFAYFANGVDAENVQGVLPAAKGGTGVASITALKGALQLDQVNNTSDVDKPISTATQTALASKVDKVEGKGLSTNDFTTPEKAKLASITDLTGSTGIVPGANGGTGVANADKTITLGGNITTAGALTTSGAFSTTLTSTGTTSVTLPTSGTLSTLTGTETLSNKTLAAPTLTGIPTAPTATAGTTTTQIATTEFVTSAISSVSSSSVPYSGASRAVNLGAYDLTVNGITVGKGLKGLGLAVGVGALKSITTGFSNVAIGNNSMENTTTGDRNVAVGDGTLNSNTTGVYNTVIGTDALRLNTAGARNTSVGMNSLTANTLGNNNSTLGFYALKDNATGSDNTAIGTNAGQFTFNGTTLNTTSDFSVYLGSGTKASADNAQNEIVIGYNAIGGGSNTIQLGNPSITDVKTSGAVTAAGFKIPGGTSAQYLRADGTVATLGTAAVPYSGAAAAVNLGAYDLTVNGITVGKGLAGLGLAVGVGALKSVTTGFSNVAIGNNSMENTTTGDRNVAVGDGTLNANITGVYNTVVGTDALRLNTSGARNASVGMNSLTANTSGNNNSTLGFYALKDNITGSDNTAIGTYAGQFTSNGTTLNTTSDFSVYLGSGTKASADNAQNEIVIGYNTIGGGSNTIQLGNPSITDVKTSGAVTAAGFKISGGTSAQYLRADGTVATLGTAAVPYTGAAAAVNLGAYDLTVNGITVGKGLAGLGLAVGVGALKSVTTGFSNVAIGNNSMENTTIGDRNVAVGDGTLNANITGVYNTVVGTDALRLNTSGARNASVGMNSLTANTSGNNNSTLGFYALKDNITGSDNTAIGTNAGQFTSNGTTLNTTSDFSVYLGSGTKASADDTQNEIVIGYNAIGGGSNTVTLGNSSITHLRSQVTSITGLSDRRDKAEITSINEGIDFVKKLNPVTFTWNTRDKAKVGIKSAGFIAQELLALQKGSTIGDNLDLVSEENPERLEARYGNLLPVLVKAIQELSEQKDQEIKRLNEELHKLTAKQEALEKLVIQLIEKK